MGTIVYQVKNGVRYAYESVSYWDKEKKAPRSKRKYLGRVDPETGEIIKAKARGEKRAPAADDAAIREKDEEIRRLKEELAEVTGRYQEAEKALAAIAAMAGPFSG